MSERAPTGGPPMTERMRSRLASVRQGLLRLHTVLLADARLNHERSHGHVAPGEMLRLLLEDDEFAWLRPLSMLVVRIDEALASPEAGTASHARELLDEVSRLLVPADVGATFARKYDGALQRLPEAVLAHGEIRKLLAESH